MTPSDRWPSSIILALILVAVSGSDADAATSTTDQTATPGSSAYASHCSACHETGVFGAPKLSDPAAWAPRLGQSWDTLLGHVVNGFNKMPPRAANPRLIDADIISALEYMLFKVGGEERPRPGASRLSAATQSSAPVTAKPAGRSLDSSAAPTRAAAAVVTGAKASAAARPPARRRIVGRANAFNRLMKPPSKRNPPPSEDGIHDPRNGGTKLLQAPRAAFSGLPKSVSGNRVDWVRALAGRKIAPRFDVAGSDKTPVIMDLDIIREVKGTMPDVVYPHKQHTEWLDCSNCHPAIFVPQKGANQMSMASILLGKQCGVCHGKVAFPVAECRKCHSNKKPSPTR